jgi:hypothetical protein
MADGVRVLLDTRTDWLDQTWIQDGDETDCALHALEELRCARQLLLPALNSLRLYDSIRLSAALRRQAAREVRRLRSELRQPLSVLLPDDKRASLEQLCSAVEFLLSKRFVPSAVRHAENYQVFRIVVTVRRHTGRYHDELVADLLAAALPRFRHDQQRNTNTQVQWRRQRGRAIVADAMRGLHQVIDELS